MNDEVFLEELDLSPGAVDMTRLNGGAPLLNTHRRFDLQDVIGVVERAWLEQGLGAASVRFSQRDDVKPIEQDVADRIIRNVSVGYDIHEMREMPRDQATGYRVMRVTKWTPTELSFVPIGADSKAQARSEEGAKRTPCTLVMHAPESATREKEAPPVQVTRTETAATSAAAAATTAISATRSPTMTTEVKDPAAGGNADDKQPTTAMAFERQRKATIINLCKANNIDERVQINWITRGTSLDKIAEEILDIVQERSNIATSVSVIGALHYGQRDPRVVQEAAFEIECSNEIATKLNRATTNFLIPAEVLRRP